MDDFENMEKTMKIVFDKAVLKSLVRCKKEGNTDKPWDDFTIAHLEKRLEQEYAEYQIAGNERELIDVINMACFLFIAKENQRIDEFAKSINIGY